MCDKMKNVSCLVSIVLTVFAGEAHASCAMDPAWSAELPATTYPAVNHRWPLCTGFRFLAPWSEGDPCLGIAKPDPIVSTYGPRIQAGQFDFHRGIDLRTDGMEQDNHSGCGLGCIPNKQPVFAVADGEVDEIEFKCKNGQPDGFRIQLKHSSPQGEWYSRYVHLSSVIPLAQLSAPVCPKRDKNFDFSSGYSGLAVTGGAHMGYTGKSVSNNHHLHFAVYKDEDKSRSAVHPVRQLPAVTNPGSLKIKLTNLTPPRVEVTSERLDVTRIELRAAVCATDQVSSCRPFGPVQPCAGPKGYCEDPGFYDYELFNYQYSHRPGSCWTNASTGCYAGCPFSSIHPPDPTTTSGCPSYSSGVHIDDASFNSVVVTPQPLGAVYEPTFEFVGVVLPSSGPFTCTKAVVFTADGSTFESAPVCAPNP